VSDEVQSLPRNRRSAGDRWRVVFITLAIVVVGLVLASRVFSGIYVDYLWHQSVDRTDVWWGALRSKLLLFALFAGVFIVLAVLNLLVADRLAPQTFAANTHPMVERFHLFFGRRLKLVRIGVAVLLGLLASAPAIGRWQDWMMFRNSQAFGIDDPQFGRDIGFYMFQLPFVTFVIDWLFVAMILVLLLVVATHVLSGGIVVQPPRPKARRATKAHVAVLLAVLALLKAVDYWLTRFELTSVSRGIVRGPTYAVVKAQLPAVEMLALVSILVAVLYLTTLRTNSWRVPVVASGLWAVVALGAGVIYPSTIQALVVTPNQKSREAPYIERNIDATRHALGIDQVEVRTVDWQPVSTGDLEADPGQLEDTRLVTVDLADRFRNDRATEAGLTINDLDADRYLIDGREEQVLVAARDLDLTNLPNKGWQGRHLISTHGCGLFYAIADEVTSDGGPVYQSPDLEQQQLYFGERLDGYAIVKTDEAEDPCPGDTAEPYQGDGGVQLSSGFRRLMFAINYLDYNLIGSSAVNGESRLLSIRDVRERVSKLAPFLVIDRDPYPVPSGGRVVWVVDAFTTSNRYPYGESIDGRALSSDSGLNQQLNYVRNSVKVVVDAYDGSVTFYIADDVDPVLRVWRSAFPDMFTPISEMPSDIAEHLRYPEDLFLLQTSAYSKYRLDPALFFDRKGAWSVAQEAPQAGDLSVPNADATTTETASQTPANDFATESDTPRFVPYYSMFHIPGTDDVEFALFRPYVPFSEDDRLRGLQSFMTATWEVDDPARLVVYEVQGSPLPDGPAEIASKMQSEAVVSRAISQLNANGSRVVLGDLQMIQAGDGILWIRPLYVRSTDQSRLSRLQHVIGFYDGVAVLGDDLQDAVEQLFPGLDGDVNSSGSGVTPDPADPDEPDQPEEQSPEELLAAAQVLFEDADQALTDRDLALYESKIAEARLLVEEALALLDT
jgi:uncharacterized protein